MEQYFRAAGVEMNSYKLPFKHGRWKITQGNTTKYSHSYRRKNLFCWDFELVDTLGRLHPQGLSHKKKPSENYSYGMPVYAVEQGRVWIRDGGTDGEEPSNIVVVYHGDGTRSIYDHIKPAGFKVGKDDQVEAGQLLGYIGFTGTKYPHIHFSVKVKKPDNWTIPVRFDEYYLCDPTTRKIAKIRDGVPLEDQIITATHEEAEKPSLPANSSRNK